MLAVLKLVCAAVGCLWLVAVGVSLALLYFLASLLFLFGPAFGLVVSYFVASFALHLCFEGCWRCSGWFGPGL